MDAYKCDRCGKLFPGRCHNSLGGSVANSIYWDEHNSHPSGTLDLCDECIASLKDWWFAGHPIFQQEG